jgi:hypothetical protein
MSADSFDQLSKALATSTSRRKFFKVAAAAAAAGVLSAVRAPEAAANHNHKCRGADDRCRSNAECCTHFCMEGHCACATPCPGVPGTGGSGGVTAACCEPGDLCCPGGGTVAGNTVGPQCVKVQATICSGGKVFSNATCRCECPAGTTTCGGTCCPDATQRCVNGVCQNIPTTPTCPEGRAPCPGGQNVNGVNCCPAGQICCGAGSVAPGQCRGATGTSCNNNNQCCSGSCPGTGSSRTCA